jgi:hypothetical protein
VGKDFSRSDRSLPSGHILELSGHQPPSEPLTSSWVGAPRLSCGFSTLGGTSPQKQKPSRPGRVAQLFCLMWSLLRSLLIGFLESADGLRIQAASSTKKTA